MGDLSSCHVWGAMPWVLDPVDRESEVMTVCQERPLSEEFVQREEVGQAETER